MLITQKQLKKIIREYLEIDFPEGTPDQKKKRLLNDLFKILGLNENFSALSPEAVAAGYDSDTTIKISEDYKTLIVDHGDGTVDEFIFKEPGALKNFIEQMESYSSSSELFPAEGIPAGVDLEPTQAMLVLSALNPKVLDGDYGSAKDIAQYIKDLMSNKYEMFTDLDDIKHVTQQIAIDAQEPEKPKEVTRSLKRSSTSNYDACMFYNNFKSQDPNKVVSDLMSLSDSDFVSYITCYLYNEPVPDQGRYVLDIDAYDPEEYGVAFHGGALPKGKERTELNSRFNKLNPKLKNRIKKVIISGDSKDPSFERF